ncbi:MULTISPECIES: phage tail tape measure protein [unclassified Proteus (in: enterobacteria)]|uniref:phage tail tape measure protein n=1 Tax=unclassified Proteus (in: enterobacteria) TaxID=257482 RepID=UPI001377324F|nr:MULTISPECIES: phage tail tape measure protein [unclassified Proteus (in: enterobacteria)]NBM11692.1 phage tail tape measure protein [Proteus sp. G2670]NBM32204.1 phage tail tape measure protein [Proteus sp. G2664]
MADIATISLKADTSDLERGTQKLKEFGDTAERVSDASRDLNDQFNRGIDHQKLASEAIKQQKKELDDLLNSINPTNKAFDALDKATQKLVEANRKGLLPKDQFADYNAILEQTRDKLTRVNMSLTAEGRALLEQERASNQAKVAADKFLASLKNQADAIGKTKTELLEMKAAQLGVSDKAAPFIKQLDEQSKKLLENAKGSKELSGGLSGITPQLSSIINQLTGGNNALSSFLSQSTGVSGSIGGLSNSLKGMLPALNPATVGITAITTATIAFGYAIHQGDAEHREYNKQLILTGGYAKKSAGDLGILANQYKSLSVAQFESAEAIAKVVGSGRFMKQEVDMVSRSAVMLKRAIGQSVEETISQFKRLQDDPVNAVRELDKEMHFLTASEYKRIIQLEDMGRKEEAARLASQSYAESIRTGANDIEENLGFLESAWKGVSLMAKQAWDDMLDIGRKKSTKEQIREIEETLVSFQLNKGAEGVHFAKTGEMKSDLEAKLATLKEKDYQESKKAQDEANLKQEEENNKKRIENERALIQQYGSIDQRYKLEKERILNDIYTSEKAKKDAIAQLDLRYARQKASLDNFQNRLNKPSLGARAEEEARKNILSLQTQLKVLNDHKTVYDVISNERKKLWETEAKISVLEDRRKERALTRDEQSLLLKEKSIVASLHEAAVLGDQIELQKIKNRELDKQNKWIADIRARGDALEEGAGLSSRLQQRKSALKLAETPEKRKELEEYYAKEDSLRSNWETGFKRGFAEFQDQATDVYGNVAQITQSAFQGMSNTVADFLLTSKFNLADFTKSFLEMTTKMITQMALLNAMRAGFAGTTFGSFLGFAEGGYTGGGGKYDPAGVVHKGEFVFTKEATQRLGVDNLYRLMDAGKRGYASGGHVGGSAPMSVTQPTAFIARNPQIAGGGNVQVNLGGINIDGGQQQQPSSNQANASSLKREFQQMVESGVNNLLRNPASALSRTIKGN